MCGALCDLRTAPCHYKRLSRRKTRTDWVMMVLLKEVEKQLVFTSKWTTAWHRGVRDTSLNAHLQSFESPITVEEEQPSLEMPT